MRDMGGSSYESGKRTQDKYQEERKKRVSSSIGGVSLRGEVRKRLSRKEKKGGVDSEPRRASEQLKKKKLGEREWKPWRKTKTEKWM